MSGAGADERAPAPARKQAGAGGVRGGEPVRVRRLPTTDPVMKFEILKQIVPVPGLAWTKGAGHPAGFYLLEGELHLAAHGSPAESWLLESGALHVANVRFDRDPAEAGHDGRRVRACGAGEVVRRYGSEPGRN